MKQQLIECVPNFSEGRNQKVIRAIASAARGAEVMAKMPAYERYMVLRRTADLMAERAEDLGQTITREEGKVIAEGRGEVQRASTPPHCRRPTPGLPCGRPD